MAISSTSFRRGGRGGPGNPFGKQREQLRAAIMECATKDEVKEIALALAAKAKTGDVFAIREYFDRVIGPVKLQLEGEIRHLHIDASDVVGMLQRAREFGMEDRVPAGLLARAEALPPSEP